MNMWHEKRGEGIGEGILRNKLLVMVLLLREERREL